MCVQDGGFPIVENLSEYCAPGTRFNEEMVRVSNNISLRVITFLPSQKNNNPTVVFIAGWISLLSAWRDVLCEMTKDFKVFYIETREKISSVVRGNVDYSVEAIGKDIVKTVYHHNLGNKSYILLGSSLGATAVLDCCRFLKQAPLCLVLIAPNAVFRVPSLGMFIIKIFNPLFYLIIKPIVKWYFRTFRLDIKSDFRQYKKYCNYLDAADPWKLKKAIMSFSKYEVWDVLENIEFPALIIGASRDVFHDPENIQKMISMMKYSTYIDLKTNKLTHSRGLVEEIRRYIQLYPPLAKGGQKKKEITKLGKWEVL